MLIDNFKEIKKELEKIILQLKEYPIPRSEYYIKKLEDDILSIDKFLEKELATPDLIELVKNVADE